MNPRALSPVETRRIGLHAHRVSIGDASRKFGISRTLARGCLNHLGLPARRAGNYTKQERKTITLHQ